MSKLNGSQIVYSRNCWRIAFEVTQPCYRNHVKVVGLLLESIILKQKAAFFFGAERIFYIPNSISQFAFNLLAMLHNHVFLESTSVLLALFALSFTISWSSIDEPSLANNIVTQL